MAQNDLLISQNISPSGTSFIERLINVAKGGLITANSSGLPMVLPVGTDNYYLKANSATVSGLEWVVAPSGGSMVYPAAGIPISTGSAWSTSITDNSTNWNTAYTNRVSSLTVTGTSGAATLISNVLNIPTYTLAGLGGQIASTNLTSLAALTYATGALVRMTAANSFTLDTTSYVSGTASALTKTDDTNVTLSLGGSPTTALLQATSLTLGWTGTLADARITSATTWNGKQAGSTNLTSLSGLSYISGSFVKMTGANTFTLDTTVYTANVGTVTSVAALTLGTTGTDLTSTIATGTSTPVITLNVPTASAANRGVLSTTDWSNFNTAYTNRITSLTVTGSSGAATLITNVLNIPTYTLAGLGGQATNANLTSLIGLTYVSASFVKMTAANTFTLDTSTYLTANQSITLSGDIGGTGTTAITTTIGVNKVTNTMLAQIATASFHGRVTAATGNVETLTGTQATSLLDTFSTTATTKGLVVGSNNVGATYFLNGTGAWSIPTGGGGVTWTATTVDATMVVNNGYLANKGTLLTMTLPATSAVGTIIRISGMNAGLWKIAQAASQVIKFGNQTTTTGTGGYLASVLTYDTIELVCIVANTTWMVVNSIGNITVI